MIFATVFLFVGFLAAGIALIRRGKKLRILLWLSAWSGIYGARLLVLTPAVRVNLPEVLQAAIPCFEVSASHLIMVFGLLVWLDLTRSGMRLFMRGIIALGLLNGLAGITWFALSGARDSFMFVNNLLATSALLFLVVVVSSRKLSERYLLLPQRGILAAGTLIFAAEALYSNLSRFFSYQSTPVLGWLGFAVLLFSLAYVAAGMIFTSERRLLAIENELETARQIQTSILPAGVPEIRNLKISAAYLPMAAVAGDFYDFMPINSSQAGFFLADVSGHGVPAALIASMIKIAGQSAADSAAQPDEFIRRLNGILANQLKERLVTAACLFLDTESRTARYSAAGHPPLLYWHGASRELRAIESNGLLLGVMNEVDYPLCEFKFEAGDLFLLYSDGLTEAENSAGESFGERRLEDLIRARDRSGSSDLGADISRELARWQKSPEIRQDDITWIVIEVV